MKSKRGVGRPTKYKPEYCQALIDFFDVEPYEERQIQHYKNGDVSWSDYKRFPNRIPTLRKFAKSINVNYTTVYEWIEKHKEFSNAFTHAKEIRKWFIIENGLEGLYNPAFAKFVAVNVTDMRDNQVNIDNSTHYHIEKKEKVERTNRLQRILANSI